MTTVNITDEQEVTVSYNGQDRAGNVEPLPAGTVMTAEVSDPSICTASVGADNSSVLVVSEDAKGGQASVGTTSIAITATLPDGSVLTDSITVNVTPEAGNPTTSLFGAVGTPSSR